MKASSKNYSCEFVKNLSISSLLLILIIFQVFSWKFLEIWSGIKDEITLKKIYEMPKKFY